MIPGTRGFQLVFAAAFFALALSTVRIAQTLDTIERPDCAKRVGSIATAVSFPARLRGRFGRDSPERNRLMPIVLEKGGDAHG